MAHIFPGNIKPILTLPPWLQLSLSLHMSCSKVGAGLRHCLKKSPQEKRLSSSQIQVLHWLLQGLPGGTTSYTPEVQDSSCLRGQILINKQAGGGKNPTGNWTDCSEVQRLPEGLSGNVCGLSRQQCMTEMPWPA